MEVVSVGEVMVVAGAGGGVLVLIGLAGFAYDRLRSSRRDSRRADQARRRADGTLRYYRDVGDSNNGSW